MLYNGQERGTAMQVTGVREFRSRAPRLLKSKDLIFVTRHGKLSSIVVPLDEPQTLPVDLRHELLERIGESISGHLKRAGVSERQVLRDFQAWRKARHAPRRGR